jgi:hypothetical protein
LSSLALFATRILLRYWFQARARTAPFHNFSARSP